MVRNNDVGASIMMHDGRRGNEVKLTLAPLLLFVRYFLAAIFFHRTSKAKLMVEELILSAINLASLVCDRLHIDLGNQSGAQFISISNGDGTQLISQIVSREGKFRPLGDSSDNQIIKSNQEKQKLRSEGLEWYSVSASQIN